jgi:GNAT superfamily N-acetyltransferase
MAIYLAPVNPETDNPRLAELMSAASRACVMVAQLRGEVAHAPPGHIHLRMAAVDAEGRMLGFGDVGRDSTMPTGRFWFDIVVDSAARGRGVGTMLYDDIVQFAREQGATTLEIAIRDDASAGLRFAARRGFTVEGHAGTESVSKGHGAPDRDDQQVAHDSSGFFTFVYEIA